MGYLLLSDISTGSNKWPTKVLEVSPKMQFYLGFDEKPSMIHFNPCQIPVYTGRQIPMINIGQTKLMVYCDLIHPQHVGDTVAPLLRSLQIQYDSAEHVFSPPTDFPLRTDYIDVIHVYIMCENGEPPPFELGTFSGTLSIQKCVSGNQIR